MSNDAEKALGNREEGEGRRRGKKAREAVCGCLAPLTDRSELRLVDEIRPLDPPDRSIDATRADVEELDAGEEATRRPRVGQCHGRCIVRVELHEGARLSVTEDLVMASAGSLADPYPRCD